MNFKCSNITQYSDWYPVSDRVSVTGQWFDTHCNISWTVNIFESEFCPFGFDGKWKLFGLSEISYSWWYEFSLRLFSTTTLHPWYDPSLLLFFVASSYTHSLSWLILIVCDLFRIRSKWSIHSYRSVLGNRTTRYKHIQMHATEILLMSTRRYRLHTTYTVSRSNGFHLCTLISIGHNFSR